MIKRIAMISVHECPLASSEGKERGGINVYVFELSKALSRLGWKVDMFTRMQDEINPKIVNVNKNARVIHIQAGPTTYIRKRDVIHYLPEFSKHMADFIQRDEVTYDITHANYYYSGVVAQHLRIAPTVMTFHTLGLLKQLVTAPKEIDDPKERIALEQSLIQSTRTIVATSENDRKYLETLYNAPTEKIFCIPPGVDTELFCQRDKNKARRAIGADPGTRIILSVGRIDPVKGFDVLLYALKILRHTKPVLTINVGVWIVGGEIGESKHTINREQQRLERLRRSLGLKTTVRFIPAQPQEKLPHYYNAADVLVMPSHYESFGMAALEALSCGTPVIATDVSGISPLIKSVPKGHLISTNNPILLAEKLSHVLTHPPAPTIEQTIQQFSWDKTAKKVAGVYNALLAAGS